jgi:hypothetical protein
MKYCLQRICCNPLVVIVYHIGMKKYRMISVPPVLVILLLISTACLAKQERSTSPSGHRYEDDEVFIRIVQRTPEQLTAFYLGREFNQASIDRILETCFITPIIHNKTLDVLWLELDHWQFSRGDEQVQRITRDYWPEIWEQTGLPQAHRSTFGWTLMPEARDLRLDESVGGSVVIVQQDQPFTMTMKFHTGADKKGPVKSIVFEDLECLSDMR